MLQEKLPSIDFVMSMAHPHELDAAFAPVAQFAAMLRGTSKPLIMVPEAGTDIALFKEMAAVCGGADSWGVYAMPTPPLVHGHHSAERLIRCAEQDVPMVYATALLQGATAPASRAACLLQTNVEMLSGLVIAELAKPGRALRVRRRAGRHERAHRPRPLLRAGVDGGAAGLRRPRQVLRPADLRLRRLLGLRSCWTSSGRSRPG